MDRDELIFQEYRMYAEQKENFIDRNFRTNRFYMVSFIAIIFAMIYTGNVVFMSKISATLIFSLLGVFICALWWMNVDSYNTLIKIKFANVLEVLEERLPVKPFTDEFKGIEEFRNKNVFMFSDIQKIIAIFGALFFFAVFISELSPLIVRIFEKIISLLGAVKGGI
ncbi:hypothetical protein J6R97_07350 [bacterium]|nr:hypothetical protein [bacterium]